MKLEYCLYSLGTEKTLEGRVNISGLLASLTPSYIPGGFSFSVTCLVKGIEQCEPHTFDMVIKSPNEEIVFEMTGANIPAIPDDAKVKGILPLETRGIFINVNMQNVVFQLNGYHKIQITIDDVKLDENLLYVKGQNSR